MYKLFKIEVRETDVEKKVMYNEYNGYKWLPECYTDMDWAVRRLKTRCKATRPYKTSPETWEVSEDEENFVPQRWNFWASAIEDISSIQEGAKVGLYYQYRTTPEGDYLRVWNEVQICQYLIGYGIDDSRYCSRTGEVKTMSAGKWEYQKVETIYPAGFSAGWIRQEFLDSVALYFWNRQSTEKIEYTI